MNSSAHWVEIHLQHTSSQARYAFVKFTCSEVHFSTAALDSSPYSITWSNAPSSLLYPRLHLQNWQPPSDKLSLNYQTSMPVAMRAHLSPPSKSKEFGDPWYPLLAQARNGNIFLLTGPNIKQRQKYWALIKSFSFWSAVMNTYRRISLMLLAAVSQINQRLTY